MTVFSDSRATSNRAVHRPVDSLCRHAVQAVRYLGITLWIPVCFCPECALYLHEHCPPGVGGRKSACWDSAQAVESYPHAGSHVGR